MSLQFWLRIPPSWRILTRVSIDLRRGLDYHESMRDKIRAAATDLFIRDGLADLTLASIADRLGISRPSIHYHYRTRTVLAEEVLEGYAHVNLDHSRAIWLDPKVTLAQKFEGSLEFARQRYLRFNPSGEGDKPWNLFARFYQEGERMSPKMVQTLKNAASQQQTYFRVAVDMAVVRGELEAHAPTGDIALQITALVNQTGWLTWSGSSFAPVEQLYRAILRSLELAYGVRGAGGAAFDPAPQTVLPKEPPHRRTAPRVAVRATGT